MTCRIRAGEVARPCHHGFTPRVARHDRPLLADIRPGDPACSGPPLLPMHFCRPVIRVAAGLGVRPDAPRRCGGVLSSVRDLGPLLSENPNGTGGLWCYSPLTRSGGQGCVRVAVNSPSQPRTWASIAALWPAGRVARKSAGPETGPEIHRSAVARSARFGSATGPPGPVRPTVASGPADGIGRERDARGPAFAVQDPQGVCQRASVQLPFAPFVHQCERVAECGRRARQRLRGSEGPVRVPVPGRVDPAQQVGRLQVTVDQLPLGPGQRGQRRQLLRQHGRVTGRRSRGRPRSRRPGRAPGRRWRPAPAPAPGRRGRRRRPGRCAGRAAPPSAPAPGPAPPP